MVKIILTNFSFFSLVALIYLFPPGTVSIAAFLVIFYVLSFSAISAFTRKKPALVVSAAITAFLLLRVVGAGNLLNLGLLAGVTISILLYIE